MFDGKWKKNIENYRAMDFIHLYLLSHITDAYLTFQMPEKLENMDLKKKKKVFYFCPILQNSKPHMKITHLWFR